MPQITLADIGTVLKHYDAKKDFFKKYFATEPQAIRELDQLAYSIYQRTGSHDAVLNEQELFTLASIATLVMNSKSPAVSDAFESLMEMIGDWRSRFFNFLKQVNRLTPGLVTFIYNTSDPDGEIEASYTPEREQAFFTIANILHSAKCKAPISDVAFFNAICSPVLAEIIQFLTQHNIVISNDYLVIGLDKAKPLTNLYAWENNNGPLMLRVYQILHQRNLLQQEICDKIVDTQAINVFASLRDLEEAELLADTTVFENIMCFSDASNLAAILRDFVLNHRVNDDFIDYFVTISANIPQSPVARILAANFDRLTVAYVLARPQPLAISKSEWLFMLADAAEELNRITNNNPLRRLLHMASLFQLDEVALVVAKLKQLNIFRTEFTYEVVSNSKGLDWLNSLIKLYENQLASSAILQLLKSANDLTVRTLIAKLILTFGRSVDRQAVLTFCETLISDSRVLFSGNAIEYVHPCLKAMKELDAFNSSCLNTHELAKCAYIIATVDARGFLTKELINRIRGFAIASFNAHRNGNADSNKITYIRETLQRIPPEALTLDNLNLMLDTNDNEIRLHGLPGICEFIHTNAPHLLTPNFATLIRNARYFQNGRLLPIINRVPAHLLDQALLDRIFNLLGVGVNNGEAQLLALINRTIGIQEPPQPEPEPEPEPGFLLQREAPIVINHLRQGAWAGTRRVHLQGQGGFDDQLLWGAPPIPRQVQFYGDQNPLPMLNTSQSTHNKRVHKTVSESATRLFELYGDQITGTTSCPLTQEAINKLELVITEIKAWGQTLGDSHIERAAKRGIVTVTHPSYRYTDDRSQITTRQLIALIWLAISDESACGRRGTLEHARALFMQAFYERTREYNLNAQGEEVDMDAPDRPACTGGTFNKFIEKLVGIHPAAILEMVTPETATIKLPKIVEETVSEHLLELSEDQRMLAIQAIHDNRYELSDVIQNAVEKKVREEFSDAFPTAAGLEGLISAMVYVEINVVNVCLLIADSQRRAVVQSIVEDYLSSLPRVERTRGIEQLQQEGDLRNIWEIIQPKVSEAFAREFNLLRLNVDYETYVSSASGISLGADFYEAIMNRSTPLVERLFMPVNASVVTAAATPASERISNGSRNS